MQALWPPYPVGPGAGGGRGSGAASLRRPCESGPDDSERSHPPGEHCGSGMEPQDCAASGKRLQLPRLPGGAEGEPCPGGVRSEANSCSGKNAPSQRPGPLL